MGLFILRSIIVIDLFWPIISIDLFLMPQILNFLNLMTGAPECNLDKLYSPVKATVNVHQGYYQSIRVSDGEYAQQVFQMLRQISNVKDLKLSVFTLQALSKASCYNLPNFRNLTQLEVGVHRHGWSMLLLLSQIFRCSPNLKVLLLKDYDPFFNGIIKNRYGNQKTDSVGGEAIFMEQSVPQCLVSFIERMEFTGFDTKSITEHLRFIEYILTNANALKVLRITLSRASPED